jgi:hypothetical protein
MVVIELTHFTNGRKGRWGKYRCIHLVLRMWLYRLSFIIATSITC